MTREKRYPINPGQAHAIKATIYDLSELAAKQALYGIVQTLSRKGQCRTIDFQEIIDDARKLTEVRKTDATWVNKKEKTAEGS